MTPERRTEAQNTNAVFQGPLYGFMNEALDALTDRDATIAALEADNAKLRERVAELEAKG